MKRQLQSAANTGEREHEKVMKATRADQQRVANPDTIDPVTLFATLGEVMPQNTIYVDETITAQFMIRQHLPIHMPQSFFRTWGGLGQGIGFALGVKLAAPSRPVVLVVGDGSFLYNPIVQAFGASKQHCLPITIVVLNNKMYRAMMQGHVKYYADGVAANKDFLYGVKIDGPSYSELASRSAFMASGWRSQPTSKAQSRERSPPTKPARPQFWMRY
jgi:acetolactate synthase I/II/III large subunit